MGIKAVIRLISTVILFFFAFLACEKEKVSSVFNPDETGNLSPIITSVDPADFGMISVTEIKIIGENFSASMDNIEGNTVYIGSEKAKVLAASNTELSVLATQTPGDSLTIKVIVPGAFKIAKFGPYKLKTVQEEYGKFGNFDKVQSITFDKDEHMYTFLATKEFIKVTPDGEQIILSNFKYPRVLDMKVGPDGYLYILAYFLKPIYRLSLTGGDVESWADLPKRSNALDFDANHNIFSAGNKTGIYRTKPDATVETKGDHGDFSIDALRVYDGSLYFLGSYSGTNTAFAAKGIWRSTILDNDGNIGDPEQVLDWEDTGNYASSKFFSFTISLDGDLYVGTDYTHPVLHIQQSGTMDSLYQNILVPPASKLEWGTDTYMYINVLSQDDDLRRIYRVEMSKEGAPYYGRE